MSLEGKNRAIFSYNNSDKQNNNFMYKDLEKTKSYHTSFINARFTGTSLRAAHMKYCNFTNCVFTATEFIGTNLRGSKFISAKFVDCIFSGVVLDKANFKGAIFSNCYIVGVSGRSAYNFPDDLSGNVVLPALPLQDTISKELSAVIEPLRENDYIRRSHTLHLKNGKINTLTIMILNEIYSNDQLVQLLPLLPKIVTTQFYTVSHLKAFLKKAEKEAIL